MATFDPKKIKVVAAVKKAFFAGTAIYVADDFIDVAKADQTLKGMSVSFLQRFPLQKNIKNIQYTELKEEFERIFQKAFPEEGQKPGRIATNLSCNSFVLRRFVLKEIPESEIPQAVSFEAQKYIPYPLEDMVYSFRKGAKKDDSLEIVFSGAELKSVQNIAEYFKTSDMLPAVIEPVPALVARALKLEGKVDKEGAYISIHYEPSNEVIITGIDRGHPVFFREAHPFPGDEEFKTSELNYPSLKDIWAVIENDVIGSVEYLRKETKKEIGKIFVSGFLPSPDEEGISRDFGIQFERLAMSSFKGTSAEKKDRYVPVLALLNDSLHTPLLNMAPQEVLRSDISVFKPVIARAAIVFLAIIAIHLIFVAINFAQTKRIQGVRRNYSVVHSDASTEDVLQYKNAVEGKAIFIDNAISKRVSITEKLIQLSKDLVPGSWIDTLTYRGGLGDKGGLSLKITGGVYDAGTGKSTTFANEILANIKQDEKMMRGFSDAEMLSVRKAKLMENEIAEFEIVMK